MFNLMSLTSPGSFSQDYNSARKNLLASLQRIDPELKKQHKLYTHPLNGPHGEELICDSLYFGGTNQPRQLLVLISATHGIEGFAGSAIQLDLLESLSRICQQDSELGILIIHALNPWGFAWLRRYDHEGIDLNRNFIDFSQPLPLNQEFDGLLNQLLNAERLTPDSIHTLWEEQGQASFTEAIARGQYQYDNACFYGGNKASWSRTVIEQITALPQVTQAQRMAVIDLHTGLGPYGYGEVINDHLPGTQGYTYAQNWYGDNAQSSVLGESCSGVKHGLLDYHWHQVIGNRGCFVTLEFGTFPEIQLWQTLLTEQVYHNEIKQQHETRQLAHPSVIALKKFFYPDEISWQQQVLFRGRQICQLALNGMKQ